MVAIWAWIIKLASGFAIWRPDKLGKMIMYVVGGVIGALIVFGIFYKVFIKSTYDTRNNVKIETVQTYYAVPQNRPFYGINILGVKIGWEGK